MKKWVIVTGGGSGIGRTLVHHFSKDYQVLTCGRRRSALEETKAGAVVEANVTVVVADIAKSEDRERFTNVITTNNDSQVYLLVQNAAIGDPATLDSIDPKHLEYAFQVNVVAPMALVQLLRPALQLGGGRVLHMGTGVAHRPQKGTLT